jgi:hypothetical protein
LAFRRIRRMVSITDGDDVDDDGGVDNGDDD